MAQSAKVIDLTRSFIPVSPRTFPETMHATQREDYPEQRFPVIPYKGHNFLPTAYGYKSYFGTTAALNIEPLLSKVDKILVFQTQKYENILVALCQDGIWTKKANAVGAWEHEIVLSVADVDTRYDWSFCTIEKGFYCYKAVGDSVYFIHPDKTWLVSGEAAPEAVITLASAAAANTLSAGAYTYSVAGILANGNVTQNSLEESITLAATSFIKVTVANLPVYTGLRLYRKQPDGTVRYKDFQGQTAISNYFDTNVNGWTLCTLPDADGMSLSVDDTTFRSFTPQFLNMKGQQGIFRAGQRLGFWDSENSVAWSSIDDFSDFTPSVTTLAGAAIFGDVTGRITWIYPHGEGFLIYAKKSIVYVRRVVDATFQWDPSVVFNDNGVAFPEEIAVGLPDITQYAWTTAGVYRIELGKAEVIIPEIFDFLKEAEDPILLQLLNGRYLYFQVIDPAYIDGEIELTTSVIPPQPFTFPTTADVDDVGDPLVLTGNDTCYGIGLGGVAHSSEGVLQGPPGGGGGDPNAGNPGSYKPVYKAYFSKGGLANAEDITWVATPCSVPNYAGAPNPYPMTPQSAEGKLSSVTQDYSNKIDAGTSWEPLQFYAAQVAIWAEGDKRREAFLAEVLNRAHSSTQVTQDQASCVVAGPTYSFCDLGEWIADTGAPFWGITSCSFYVYRYITKKVRIQTVGTQRTLCSEKETPVPVNGWTYQRNAIQGFYHSTEAAAWAQLYTDYPSPPYTYEIPDARGASGPLCTFVGIKSSPVAYLNNFGVTFIASSRNVGGACPAGYNAPYIQDLQGSLTTECVPSPQLYTKTLYAGAHNQGDYQSGIFGVDVGILELVGWNYTNSAGVTSFISRSGGQCTPPMIPPKPSKPSTGGSGGIGTGGNLGFDDSTGAICGIPFDPITIPDLGFNNLPWPAETITYPSVSFLLQDGSIGPKYPDYVGAYVYDTFLKKWGKYKGVYKRLLDYSPINSSSGGVIPYSTFGMKAGVIKSDGYVYLFDWFPEDSYIAYGKIGYARLGMTNLEEITLYFRTPSTGTVEIEGSLDGSTLEAGLAKLVPHEEQLRVNIGANLSGHWFNILVTGIFDLTHMEFRGVMGGRR